jgi:CHAD domain-containing protein
MAEKNILLKALDVRSRKLRKEWDRTRKKYSEDSVHDLRVASRRLIAVLETLNEIHQDSDIRECRRRVKNLLDGLSPLRDLQVQRANVGRMLDRFPQLKDFEKSLADKESRTARKVQKLLRRVPKLDNAITRARRHASKRIGRDDVLKVIDRRYRKVLSLAARIDPTETDTIHRMRLAFKKFRYTCEVAHPIIRNDVNAERLEQFHTFQTMMGDIQDVEILSARLAKWTEKQGREQDMEPVFEELKADRQRKITAFVDSAREVETFWKSGMRK